MQVILLEKIRNLGNLGDQVDVKPGFMRNYLIPHKKAVYATNKNIAIFEQQRAELEKKIQQTKAAAQEKAAHLSDVFISINVRASDEGKLYGSVGAHEIQEALKAKGIEISKRDIVIPQGPLHYVGDYIVEINLHSDVIAKLQVQITADAEQTN